MYSKNRVFEPLFGGKLQEVVTNLQKEEATKNSVNLSSKSEIKLQQTRLSGIEDIVKNKIFLILIAIILIAIIYFLTISNKQTRARRRNPKKLSRFVKASRRETLE